MRVLSENVQNERGIEFHKVFFSMNADQVNSEIAAVIANIYRNAKELRTKNQCIKLLFDKDYSFLEDFFRQAYAKARYLDMKMNALRGLAQFVAEGQILEMLKKFNVTLRKRPESTPYNYLEYELLRGKHALPYLVNRYGYACFQETLNIVNEQYDAMPDAFKGHFTTDEYGDLVSLRSSETAGKMMQEFFANQRST